MDSYVESNVSLLMRLTREAHAPNIEVRTYKLFAKAISDVLSTVEKHHGLYYLQYIAYVTSVRLGHALGPIHENIALKLTGGRGMTPNSSIKRSQTCGIVHKQNQYVS